MVKQYTKHERQCHQDIQTENTTRSGLFLTKWAMFGLPMKHCLTVSSVFRKKNQGENEDLKSSKSMLLISLRRMEKIKTDYKRPT